jgi:hypothetical protein
VLKDVVATGATLLETGDRLAVKSGAGQIAISIPDGLRDKLPERVAYCIRLSGAS